MDKTVAPGAANGGSTPPRNIGGCVYNIIDGKLISSEILLELKERANVYNVTGKNRVMADIQVGNDESSKLYIESKKKKFHDIGLKLIHIELDKNVSQEELVKKIDELNVDKNINGIFLELPLPNHINEKEVLDKISPYKDIDGFNSLNAGALLQGNVGFFPCTAEGIVELLKRSNIEIKGKHCVVIGRSNIVGKPVAMLLLREDATVTICHSKSKNIKEICKTADILIVAIGKPKYIDETYIKEGAIVIDAGIHRIDSDGKKIVCGDVDFDKVASHTSYITPVPGGVGPMTVTILIKHCLDTVNLNG